MACISSLCSRLSSRPFYRWVILLGACMTFSFTSGFTNGFMGTMGSYFSIEYNERTLSSSIGGIQMAVTFLAAVPAALIMKRVGERWTQLTGGVLTVLSLTALAFTKAAWQGLLCCIIHGIGGAFATASAYSMIAKYFPDNQLVPASAMMVSFNIVNMLIPTGIGALMNNLGFRYAMLACAGMMLMNILSALVFEEKSMHADNDDESKLKSSQQDGKQKFTLKIKGRKCGIFHIPQHDIIGVHESAEHYRRMSDPERLSQQSPAVLEKIPEENSPVTEKETPKTMPPKYVRQGSTLSAILEQMQNSAENLKTKSEDACQEKCEPKKNKQQPALYDMMSQMEGYGSIAELLHDRKAAKATVLDVIRNPAAMNYILSSFVVTAGMISYQSNASDFVRSELGYSSDQFNFGLTIMGIAQLCVSVCFVFISNFFTFSACFVYVISIFANASITFFLMSDPSEDTFYLAMALNGFMRACFLFSQFPSCLEVTSPTQSVMTFMLQNTFDGIGGLIAPYAVSYLQVNVDSRAGMALAGCLQAFAALIMLPRGIQYLMSPKTYTEHDKIKEKVQQTGYLSYLG